MHPDGQGEDLGQEDLPGPRKPPRLGRPLLLQGEQRIALWTGLAFAESQGSAGRALCNLNGSSLCGLIQVQSFLLHFWQGMPPHMLPVLGSSTVVNIVGVCDSILYKAISGVLMPTVLQALPDRWARFFSYPLMVGPQQVSFLLLIYWIEPCTVWGPPL